MKIWIEKKFKYIALIFILCLVIIYLLLTEGLKNRLNKKDSDMEVSAIAVEKPETLFKLEKLWNGDAKLLSNQYVITGKEGLMMINPDGDIIKHHTDIHVNWLDVYEEERIIVYGNFNKEIGICRYDDNYEILSNKIIFNVEKDLGIDPAICKVNDLYYITITYITGTINNADLDAENGLYEIVLYSSSDLENWNEVSSVIKIKQNVEDIDLNYFNGQFYLTYEKEQCDKGKSSINVLISEDSGKTWGNNIVLVEENADNEPASFFTDDEGYCLYYSSDIEKPGSTYEGAKVYRQKYDKNLNKKGESREVPLQNNEGNLLYDVEIKNKSVYLLFSQNYITKSNLILEKTSIYEEAFKGGK